MKIDHKLYHYSLFWLCLVFTEPILAQELLKGQVKDSHGPLPGVTVQVKNSTNGTLTDQDGNYTIKVNSNDRLIFSFIGYHSQEILVSNQRTLDIALKIDSEQLAEININAGYYSVKDRERTGNIAKITAKQIENKGSNNILDAMQGQAAGVQIIQKSGLAGGGFDIKIRGQNSLRTIFTGDVDGNTPLYIIDGMPITTERKPTTLVNLTMPRGITTILNTLNPNDIESIEILKDADATAIYGSRGANGVVLITTKRNHKEGTMFSLNSYTGWGNIAVKTPLMKTDQFIKMNEEAYTNDGITNIPATHHWMNGNWNKTRYTDWQKVLTDNTMQFHHFDFGMNGGNSVTNYKINLSKNEQGTTFIGNSNQKQISVQTAFQHRSKNEDFHFNFSGGYSENSNNLPGVDFTNIARNLQPNAPNLYTEDGSLNWENSTWDNPVQNLEQKVQNSYNLLHTSLNTAYQILPNLGFLIQAGYSKNNTGQVQVTPSTYFNPAYGLDSSYASNISNNGESTSWNIEPQLNWFLQIGKHQLSAIAGLTFLSQKSELKRFSASNFSSDKLIYNIKAGKNISIPESYNTLYRYTAMYGRFNYTYDNRYILNFTGRRDGSSRFGVNNRFANFGAVGGAWIFSKESFAKDLAWLSFGKFRGSYGTTGNDNIGDYQFLNTYSPSGTSYETAVGLVPDRLYNPDFSWEQTNKLEFALELSFLKDRINTSIAWYDNRSSNQLVGTPLPGTTGFSSVQANLDATIQNKGWEFTLQSKILQSETLNWNSSFNLSIPKSKLLSFPSIEATTYNNFHVVGQSLNVQKLYNYLGVNSQTGLYEVYDYGNDGITSDDRQVYLNTAPKWYGGWQNNISYKKWDVALSLYFVKQLGRDSKAFSKLGISQNLTQNIDRWQQVGDISSIQKYSATDATASQAYSRMSQSTGAYTDASFIRMKDLQIAYNLTLPQLPKFSCRVYAKAENLLTITKYKGGDPETQFDGYLPPLKQFIVGTQINF